MQRVAKNASKNLGEVKKMPYAHKAQSPESFARLSRPDQVAKRPSPLAL